MRISRVLFATLIFALGTIGCGSPGVPQPIELLENPNTGGQLPPHLESAMDYRQAIERYYRAFRERDLEGLRSLLTPDFHFVSSFGEYRDRDAMLDQIWPAVGQTWATNLRVFGDGPEFVVLYEHENAPGVQRPAMAMAEYVRFEGERIAEIEVFVGRPLAPPASP